METHRRGCTRYTEKVNKRVIWINLERKNPLP